MNYFEYDGKTYRLEEINRISGWDLIQFDKQCAAMGVATRWGDMIAIRAAMEAIDARQLSPDERNREYEALMADERGLMLQYLTRWAAMNKGGTPITLEDCTKIPLADFHDLPAAGDHEAPKAGSVAADVPDAPDAPATIGDSAFIGTPTHINNL